ncbi:PPOX class F420-dependent oxidoreductase [Micromonospora sp. CPCC 205371]|nr:PPOX class F420-dependent oxidoreductase [Micromonospora sp. CPCC 205371]
MAIDLIGDHRFSQCVDRHSVVGTTHGTAGIARSNERKTPMTTMTDNEWRAFVTAGTRLAHIALARADGRPHVTPVCFILDGDELAFALSPGSVKGKSLARDGRVAVCVSDERQPYGFVTMEGHARTSAEPDQVKHIAAGIAGRYYPSQPAEDIVESFVREGFTAVRIAITNVIARSGLG